MSDLRAGKSALAKRENVPGWLVLGALAAFVVVFLVQLRHDRAFVWFEDLPVYRAAVEAFLDRADPYAAMVPGLRFVYTPLVLYPLSWLVRLLPGQSAWSLIGAAHLLAVVAAPLVLARYYLRQPWLTPAMAVLVWLAEPGFVGIRTVYSANLVSMLYLAALLTAIPGLRRNHWHWFYLVVLLAGTMKITLLVLLLLPVLTGIRQWVKSVATVVAVGAVYLAQQHFLPTLFAGYKRALFQQFTIDKRYGYGVFGLAAEIDEHVRHNLNAAYSLHVVFAAALCALLLALKYRGCDRLQEPGRPITLWRGLILMAVILVNPRILHYDFYLALFAAFVVLAVAFRLEGWNLVALVPVVYLPSLLQLPGVHPWLPAQVYQVCLVLFALAIGIWHLWQETTVPLRPAANSTT